MKKNTPTKSGAVRVTFELPASVTAEEVAVSGEFNDWSTTATPMRRLKNGDGWRASVTLEPGRRYRYRYVADQHKWLNDWAADDYEPNPYGGDDSVLVL